MERLTRLEEIRFGYGPQAGTTPATGSVDPDRVLAQLTASDPAAAAFDRPPMAERFALIAQAVAEKQAGMVGKDSTGQKVKLIALADAQTFVSRPAAADLGFVERLVNLWANRITVSDVSGGVGGYIQSFRDEAVRPNIAGRYVDLLRATIWHPAMQIYLTQRASTGPNSTLGLRKGKGLNENLAREFLELHAMGRGYTQGDVTELARLLAGMASDETGRHVDQRRVEPGAKVVLGVTYPGDDPRAEIDRMVDDVAARPETAAAVAFFLARHFVADVPPADLVASLAQDYTATGGDLPSLYRVLLTHPAARSPDRVKLRSPQEYAAAALRLFGLNGQEKDLPGFRKRGMQVPLAMTAMGQPIFRARRPDGWPEVADGWMTPPMVAARVDWAVDLARAIGARGDPAAAADLALGDLASPLLHQSVRRAEQRWEGIAVLLASPDFSRR